MEVATSNNHEKYIRMAELAGVGSTCAVRHVGAVIVRNGVVLSSGWNGVFLSKSNSCVEAGCPRCSAGGYLPLLPYESCVCLHAEQYAISSAAKQGILLEQSTLYSTLRPCIQCVSNALCAGVSGVIYKDHWEYQERTMESMHEKLRSEFAEFRRSSEFSL